ncbi:hypothetical protein E4U40_003949 [Claviceps sp. LM458 group G5]|nr:hypothetical protein E4U40_003949 [Claviceps sp. LM458 group G5]
MLHETIGNIGSRGIEPVTPVNVQYLLGTYPPGSVVRLLQASLCQIGRQYPCMWKPPRDPRARSPSRLLERVTAGKGLVDRWSVCPLAPGEVVALSPAMPPMRLPLGGKREASGHLV